MKFLLSLMMAMLLIPSPSRGEDVTVITNPESQEEYTISTSYIQLEMDLTNATQVILTVSDDQGEVIHQQHYGTQEYFFQSDEVYLPVEGAAADYGVEVSTPEDTRTIRIHRTVGKLQDNRAVSVGLPLSTLTGENTWKSATLLDATSDTTVIMPLHASNQYQVGDACFTLSGGQLTVTVSFLPELNETVRKTKVQVATTALEAQSLGTKSFRGQAGKLSDVFPLGDAQVVAVYLELTLDYFPNSALPAPQASQPGQEALWELMRTTTVNDAVG